jgi:hypothetical protein
MPNYRDLRLKGTFAVLDSVIRRDLYDRLTEYDDSPWTDEEMDALASEVDAMLDDDMAVEDTEA